MNKPLAVFLIIAFNLAPVAGVIYFNWEPFEAFWFFWLETLVIALFNTVRVFYSQHRPDDSGQQNTEMMYHGGKAIRYLFIRIFIFVFYSIFVITFIGFVANENGDKVAVVRTLVFQNTFFNLGLLISIVSQAYFLIVYFFRNGSYLISDPSEYAAFFDARQIVMHVAVIVGTFASIFLAKKTTFGAYGSAALISVLCICKCAVELYNYNPALKANPTAS